MKKRNRHQVQCYQFLIRMLNIYRFTDTFYLPDTGYLREGIKLWMQECGLTSDDKIIALNPGGAFGYTKRWKEEYFIELCRMIEERGIGKVIVLWGSPEEKIIAMRITQKSRAVLIPEYDLLQLAELLKMVDVLVSGDTGPMHIASVLRRPVVAIFGPTSPERTRPYFKPYRLLYDDKLECRPCYKKICPLKHHNCMKNITPEMVLKEVSSMLSG